MKRPIPVVLGLCLGLVTAGCGKLANGESCDANSACDSGYCSCVSACRSGCCADEPAPGQEPVCDTSCNDLTCSD